MTSEKNDNLVSIIMPAHNASCTIAESIDSVIAQTYRCWELIVVDDCSTDSTVDVVIEYCNKDERICLFHTKQSEGKPYLPKNEGIRLAKGRYIAFLDSDDLWLPEKLEKQMQLFENNDKAAIVFSDYCKFSDGGDNDENQRIVKGPAIVAYKNAVYGNPIGNLTAVYDTAKVGKVYFVNAGHEDYILWLTILRKGYEAVNTCSVEAKYRVRIGSVSANKGRAAYWVWNIYRNILKMNPIQAMFCYVVYSVRAIIKYLK